MRGQKTIEIDAAIRYPIGNGKYGSSNRITLRAPGLSMFHTHAKIHAYVMKGLFEISKQAAIMKGAEQARRDAEMEDSKGFEPKAAEMMDQLSIGLGVDGYPEFLAYAKKVLTNSALASIGDPAGKLTDEAWDNLEEACGMTGVTQVIGEFALFFINAQTSKSENGSASPTISSSDTAADSMPSGPIKRRLSN